MRRIVAMLLVLVVLISQFALFAAPASADASNEQCWEDSITYRNNTLSPASVDLYLNDDSPQTHYYTVTETLQPGETRRVAIHGLFPLSANSFGAGASTTLTFVSFGTFGRVAFEVCAGVNKITDGRINDTDLGAPLAAYCKSGGMEVWDIDDTGHGSLAFTVSNSDIKTALTNAVASGQNVLVAQGLGDSLYALSTNQLTLVGPDVREAGKTYQFITTPDICG